MNATVKQHAATWFELPARDLERAAKFYETILDASMPIVSFGPRPMAVFAHSNEGVGGCLVAGTPSPDGAFLYLDVTGRLDETLARTQAAGGRVTIAPYALPNGRGTAAEIVDSEGNRVGLHANS